ncbi:MAG: UDP-N-acetylenolpyruvoylglucosamine reductase, partial [Erysipelotrichaceae bacterium]|nr:UDP-N-acetylenolpyruvoylglucosamine reductase [Erysipelotrichaceae bacterium]
VILAARMQLTPGDRDAIRTLMSSRQKRRFETQPLEFPSAGSVFRNPEGDFAWKYVDLIGYRGHSIGDACVSEKHSNFIVNKGKATGTQILTLIEEIQSKVKELYDIDLIMEVEKFNWKK